MTTGITEFQNKKTTEQENIINKPTASGFFIQIKRIINQKHLVLD